jgi:hypothetical protein
VVQQRVAAVFGGLDHAPVLLASQRQPVRAGDPAAQEPFHGAGHLPRVFVDNVAERRLLVGRRLADSGDRAVPAVKHGDVLGHCDLVRGLVELLEVRVISAAIGVAELGPRQLEVRAQLDQRQDTSLEPRDPLGWRRRQRPGAPEIRRRMLPAMRTGKVDQLASGKRGG